MSRFDSEAADRSAEVENLLERDYEREHRSRLQSAVQAYCRDSDLERIVFAAGLTGCYEDDEIAAWAASPTPSADAVKA